jgi:hypothetical protein
MQGTTSRGGVLRKMVSTFRMDEDLPDLHWKCCGACIEGQPIDVDGIDPWHFEHWHDEHQKVQLPHPQYSHQRHSMSIYSITTDGRKVVFAAGELSANVWGFYIPE